MVNISNISINMGNGGLRNIDFDIPEKHMLTIIGKSGSGKTMLLRTILGIIKPDRGNVYLFNTDIHSADKKDIEAIRKKTGVLFQNNALFDSMSVYENVSLALTKGYMHKDYRHAVGNMLSTVHLGNIGDSRIHELSGGMMKRVAIARAMINDPDIIFYDEPITGLDPITAEAIIDLIREIYQKTKRTTVVITHDIRGFIDFTDSVLLLDNGMVRFMGSRDEFLASEDDIIIKYRKSAGHI